MSYYRLQEVPDLVVWRRENVWLCELGDVDRLFNTLQWAFEAAVLIERVDVQHQESGELHELCRLCTVLSVDPCAGCAFQGAYLRGEAGRKDVGQRFSFSLSTKLETKTCHHNA